MRRSPLALIALSLACAESSSDGPAATVDVPTSSDAAVAEDTSAAPELPELDVEEPPSPDAEAPDGADSGDTGESPDTTPPPPPPEGPETRGFVALRGALHVHSIFSHDACDGRTDEQPDAPDCLADFRAQLCTSGLDFAFLTDHPSNMSSYPFDKLLLHDAAAGDVMTYTDGGAPFSNAVACPATVGGPARPVHLTVGFEGTHTMPLGLEAHLEPASMERVSLTDDTPEADRKAVVDAIHAQNGVVCIAHSEETELSAETIAALPIDAMEQYNMHANIKNILEKDIGRLFGLERFMDGAEDPPSADLVLLAMLDAFPEPGIEKWYTVSSQRPITGVVGSDVHQNVTTDGYCTPGGEYEALCDTLAEAYPVLVANLKKGGPLLLGDKKRIDSYERVFRWLHNRVYATENSAKAIREAIRAGRTVSVFTVFGEPRGLDLYAKVGDAITELGGTVSLADKPTLEIKGPGFPSPQGWVEWLPEEAEAAEIETHLIGFSPAGEKLLDVAATGGVNGSEAHLTVTPDVPGRYHVEVLIRPKHLIRVLHAESALADTTYRWAVTNPIYVTP